MLRYIKFVEACQLKDNVIGIERHHILPKCIFPNFKSLKENAWNCAKLTYRQHYIAHWILTKVFVDAKFKAKMCKAFWALARISKDHYYREITSKMYEKAKEANSYAMKISNPMKNEIHVNTMKEGWKNFLNTERGVEYRKRRSLEQMGKCNITDDGMKRLRNRWLGIKRGPQTDKHKLNNIISNSRGLYVTPFGEFYNPSEAERSENNIEKISRYLIDKFCKEQTEFWKFIPKIPN